MNYKKGIILFYSIFFVLGGAFAQRFKVTSAYNYEKAFRRDKDCKSLKKGIAAINDAIKDSKTKNESKTWYYRGNLYFDIGMAKKDKCNAIDPNAMDIAMDSYIKSMKLGFKDESYHNLDIENNPQDAQKFVLGFVGALKGDIEVEDAQWYKDIVMSRFPYIGNHYYNQGVKEYSQKRDYKAAYNSFSKAAMINQFTAVLRGKLDTSIIYNIALAAEQCKDTSISNKAIPIYEQLIKMGYKSKGSDPYLSLYNLQMKAGDTTEAHATLVKGRKDLPNDGMLIRTMVDYNLQNGNDSAALNSLTLAIENGDKTPILLFARGTVYDKLGDYDKAVNDYKAAIKDSSEYFDAYYNLGALYFNKGADYNNQANKLPMGKNKESKKLQEKANNEFKKAQPYLEKAHKINPDKKGPVVSLLKIYAMTSQTDKYKALKASY